MSTPSPLQSNAHGDADALAENADVLAVVSHDLRDPLSTIAMAASLLTDSELTLTPEQQRQQLGVIARTAQRMNQLIQDLLDITRIEGGRFRVSKRNENASALVTDARDSYRQLATEKNVELVCDVEGDLPPVNVDHARVMQLLSNYIGNAIKFSRPGGRVRIRARRSESGGVVY